MKPINRPSEQTWQIPIHGRCILLSDKSELADEVKKQEAQLPQR